MKESKEKWVAPTQKEKGEKKPEMEKEERREYLEKVKEEAKEMKKLLDLGEVENWEEACDRIIEQKKELESWAVRDKCDSERIPEFLKRQGGLDTGKVFDYIYEANKDKLRESLEKDKDTNEFVKLIKKDKEGLVDFKKGQTEEAKNLLQTIRRDGKKIGLLSLKLPEKFGNIWGCGRFGGFKDPSTCGSCVEGRTNLRKVFDNDIPYLEYEGERCYSMKPFGKRDYGFDKFKILALFGKKNGENLLDNLDHSREIIGKLEDERWTNKKVIELLGSKYKEVARQMPEAIEFLKETISSKRSVSLEDIDLENKTLVLMGSRSEWGSSGGIGYFSQAIVWHNGQYQEKEYQWRDRWSAANDNHRYNFSDLKIKRMEDKGKSITIEVKATAGKEYSPVIIDFTFDKIIEPSKFKELSEEEQIEFKKFVEQEVERVMKEKLKLWEVKPQMLFSIETTVPIQLPAGTPSYVNYQRPEITSKVVRDKIGLGAFIAKEQIDHRTSDPQLRYELYVAKHGEEAAKMLYEDHAYLKREGDPSITGLRIVKGKIVFTTREGQKELE